MQRVLPILFGVILLAGCDIGRGGGGDGKPDVPQTAGNGSGDQKKKDGASKGSAPGTNTGAPGSEDTQQPETKPVEPVDSGDASSCLYSSPVKMCFQYTQSLEATQASCLNAQGQASAEPCDTTDAVGACGVSGADGQVVLTIYYPPQETATVKQTCEGGNGVFVDPSEL